jgi:hypothetical protein
MRPLDGLLFLVLFVRSSFLARVMIPLMFSVVWRQIDTLCPQLSPVTCQSCKDQKATLELHHMYDFLTQLCDEFEPLCAQLLTHHPCVSLMDDLAEVYNEETHLQDTGLLPATSVLATRSSVARPTAPVPLVSPSVALFAACGASTGLYYDHYGRDGHVEAFCYKKKKAQKAQARCSSQSTGGSGSGGSERSSAGSDTQELLMLFHLLAASTSAEVVGSVTQSSAHTCSATASQSSTLGPPSAHSSGTFSWYLNSGASFHMTPHSVHLFSMSSSYRHLTVQTVDGLLLSIAGHDTLCSDSFYVPDISLVLDLTMQLMSGRQIADYGCHVILDPDFCYIQDRRTGHLVGTGP